MILSSFAVHSLVGKQVFCYGATELTGSVQIFPASLFIEGRKIFTPYVHVHSTHISHWPVQRGDGQTNTHWSLLFWSGQAITSWASEKEKGNPYNWLLSDRTPGWGRVVAGKGKSTEEMEEGIVSRDSEKYTHTRTSVNVCGWVIRSLHLCVRACFTQVSNMVPIANCDDRLEKKDRIRFLQQNSCRLGTWPNISRFNSLKIRQ